MTPTTRRNVLRYGIAIDLVILAIGVAMLVPPTPGLLLTMFATAVLVSTWKGGWQGGLTALVLSVVALAAMFDSTPRSLALFAVATAIAAGVVVAVMRSRVGVSSPQPAVSPEAPLRSPVEEAPKVHDAPPVEDALPPPPPAQKSRKAERAEARRLARLEEERAKQARKEADRVAREEADRQKALLDAERAEAERIAREAAQRVAREAEEKAAREREEAERTLAAQLDEQRAEAERERVRLQAERAEAERAAREAERAAREREESERLLAAQLEAQRAEAERERVRLEAERAEAERAAREAEERAAREREEAERAHMAKLVEAEQERARLEAERAEAERAARDAGERAAREREEAERARLAAERTVAREREELERVAREREAAQRELEAKLTSEREELERARKEVDERVAAEREQSQRELQAKLEAEREAMRIQLEEQLAAERAALAKEAKRPAPPPAPKPSILDAVSGWFKRPARSGSVNLTNKRMPTNGTATKRPKPSAPSRAVTATRPRGPRLVFLERRRGTADTILPKLRQKGMEVAVVERWVDAADEILRIRPDAFFLDLEHPDFGVVYKTTVEKSPNLPIVLTGRSPSATPPNIRYASFLARPYDPEEITRIAQQAMGRPDELLAIQAIQRTPAGRSAPPPPAPVAAPVEVVTARPKRVETPVLPTPSREVTNDEYAVPCYTCRVEFNAVEADWCSCLAKERTLVCTNCLACFCKAPPAYKEKFWVQAPPKLFERKTSEARRQEGALPANPSPDDVARPLVLTVEDDEDIQTIVQRVCTNLGYGVVHATNGQDGLDLARAYRPNLILSDAFMPKLDGREMCRMLKEDPSFADTRMVVMTGLYTDTKYRSEALKRFHIDDYIAKPVAVTDLINLLQRHLEGVSGLPAPEDLHELHRKDVDALELDSDEDVPLADALESGWDMAPAAARIEVTAPKPAGYEVCCFNCDQTFDAARGEWCSCVGRDNTIVCEHCGGCFCKAPAAYKERFWIDAPPSLFERKMIGSKRNVVSRANPPAAEVKRPLILLVEDDENVQLIVRTVVTTMGFGFVVGANGQEGLTLAREYSPELILSDAFMPKLDGREMCRLLKEDPTTARSKAIIMTGLYTDRKYRNEALDYFKVDDYVAKPLAVDDLIKLFKKHLPHEMATAN